MKTKDQENFPA